MGNFARYLLDNGFEPLGWSSKLKYTPEVNFFGTSAYEPDVILCKDNKKVWISMMGLGTIYFVGPEYKNKTLRPILFFIDDKMVYKSLDVPEEKIIEEFVNGSDNIRSS